MRPERSAVAISGLFRGPLLPFSVLFGKSPVDSASAAAFTLPFVALLEDDAKEKEGECEVENIYRSGDSAEGALSRRSFFKGMGAAALAAGALGTVDAVVPAHADERAIAVPDGLQAVYGEEAAYIPVRKGTWSAPNGPVAFEDREISDDEIATVEDCDVLVVGAGVSGMMAMLTAAEEGARVIAAEKMTKGRSAWESIGGCDSRYQREINRVPDPLEYFYAIMRANDYRQPAEVIRAFIDNSGETVDFMGDMIDRSDTGIKIFSREVPANPYGYECIQGEHSFEIPEKYHWTTWLLGPPVMGALTQVAQAHDGIDLRFRTAAVQLVRDKERVVGAILKDMDQGTYHQVNAKAVILSTGGYEANAELVEAWTRPEDYTEAGTWDPSQGTTGDGHMMGLAVGASIDPMPHPLMSFGVATPFKLSSRPGMSAAVMGFAIAVNEKAKRFMCEGLQMNFAANALVSQKDSGAGCWKIFDYAMACATADPADVDAVVAEAAEKDWLKRGDTVEELADALGMDPTTLAETVETYNSYFQGDNPIDSEFGCDLSARMPFTKGPFFAAKMKNMILATCGGLTIDGSAHVLDADHNIIDGLYASGNVAGSFYSGSYPRHLPATSVGRCATFGRIAGRNAAKGE